MTLIFPPFTKMAFSDEDKHVIKFFRQKKHFLIKTGLVVYYIRLFARLIVGLLELRIDRSQETSATGPQSPVFASLAS